MPFDTGALRQDTDARFSAFDQMLKHLEIDPGPEHSSSVEDQLRAALECCFQCAYPGLCRSWCSSGKVGTPVFCRGVEAFTELQQEMDERGIVSVQDSVPRNWNATIYEDEVVVRLFA